MKLRLLPKFTLFSFLTALTCLTSLQGKEEIKPSVVKCSSAEEVGEKCAIRMINLIKRRQKQGRRTVLGLATGSTPLPVYQAFIRMAKEENLDLSDVHTFNLDEYVGLPPGHSQSYQTFMEENLFGALRETKEYPNGLRDHNIHLLNGYAKTINDLSEDELASLRRVFPGRVRGSPLTEEEESLILRLRTEEFEAQLQRLGPIDFQILGIGTNGHIGFAEPGSSFEGRTSIVELAPSTRKDNSRFFISDTVDVPARALSMGIASILEAKYIVLLATGEHKSSIIEQVLKEPITPDIPATALRNHDRVTFILDSEAAKKL